MDNVQNKTVIVTGAGSGIGYQIVEELLRKGAKKIAIIDLPIARSYDAIETLQEKFGKDRVILFPIDVTNLEVYSETFKQIVKAFNGLDILVNNAGMIHDRCIEQTFDINVIALIRGSMLGLDYMGNHKGGKGGTIVNISSMAGLRSSALYPVYSSSKFAIVAFGRNLEKLYDKTGVRILTMCPGYTATAMQIATDLSEERTLDIVDEEILENLVNTKQEPQSAVHVGQSVVIAIQKGENGSIWVITNNEPPYPVKIPPFVAA